MKAAARLGFFIGVSLLLRCPLCAPQPVTALQFEPVATAAHQFAPDRHDREDSGDGFVDLYGNEVNDAVAEYTLDAAGGLYEVHSPQTDLLNLAPPRT